MHQLTPFLDNDGILKAQGRLQNATSLEYSTKHPIILESKHPLSTLIVKNYHEKSMHQGNETVVNYIKQKFFIFGLRNLVKSVSKSCQFCINKRSAPLSQIMGNLPQFRLEPNLPVFAYTGVDFFGPIMVKVGRRHEKRWGVIFTCLTSRAVHLELSASLSTDSTIMAIRRFKARRGNVKVMYSDNGTNFKGASNELKKAINDIDQNTIHRKLIVEGMTWSFIPPAAPHFGGCWERLIKTVKVALYNILKERYPKEEMLYTLFAEIEYLINSRPLTYVSTDPQDTESITPNDILLGKRDLLPPPGVFSPNDEIVKKQWRTTQFWIDQFWIRWKKEYLTTLLPRIKNFTSKRNLQIGDVVKILDQKTTRGDWPIGRITKILPGDDNHVRVVEVKTAFGVFLRPITKLTLIVLNNEIC